MRGLGHVPNTMRTTTHHVLCALLCAGLFALAGCARNAPVRAPAASSSEPVATARPASAVPVDARLDATVAQLRSEDFVTRTRAARALVAAGEAALPALGRAGSSDVTVAGDIQVSSTHAVIDTILARTDEAALARALTTEWAVVRRSAATELGRRDGWDSIPLLLRRLEDGDADVRHASASALRRLTNNFFGFRAQASAGNRRRAATLWRDWWVREGRAEAEQRASADTASR